MIWIETGVWEGGRESERRLAAEDRRGLVADGVKGGRGSSEEVR